MDIIRHLYTLSEYDAFRKIQTSIDCYGCGHVIYVQSGIQ